MIEIPDWEVSSEAIGSNECFHINAATLEVTHDRCQHVWLNHTLANHLSIVELNNHHNFSPPFKEAWFEWFSNAAPPYYARYQISKIEAALFSPAAHVGRQKE
jgi:hypothetical protein